jgi:hypothetical protein
MNESGGIIFERAEAIDGLILCRAGSFPSLGEQGFSIGHTGPGLEGGCALLPADPGTITHGGPKLIFSDSPEMVGKIGIMYRDTVSGPVRLFFHHVNDTRTDKRLAVLLRRTTIRPTAVSMGRNGISRPNEDWLAAGKEAQSKYYRSVPNGRKLVLDGPRDILNNGRGYILHPQELVTGIVDLNFDKAGGSFLHHDARGCGSPDFGGSIFHPAAGRRGPCAPGHL